MNVSTSSLLSLLAPKLTNNIKQTIDSLAKDGKIDVQTALKDKNIQQVLGDLFKDTITHAKTKNSVNELLSNSKNLFDIKNLSSDLKSFIQNLEKDPKLSAKVEILKEFMVNIKNLDENVLKNNISNSGVFLESKLKSSQSLNNKNIFTELFTDIKELKNKHNDKNSLNTIKNILTNIQTQVLKDDIKVQVPNSFESTLPKTIKADIAKLLVLVKNIEQMPQETFREPLIKELIKETKSLESKFLLENLSARFQTNENKQSNLTSLFASIKQSTPQNIDTQNIKQNFQNLLNQTGEQLVSKNLPKDIKIDIQKLLILVKNIEQIPQAMFKEPLVKELIKESNNLESKVLNNAQNKNIDLKSILNVLSNIFTSIKQATPQNPNMMNIKQNLLTLQNSLLNTEDQKIANQLPSEIKVDIQRLLTLVKNIEQIPQEIFKEPLIKELIKESNNLESKIANSTQNKSLDIKSNLSNLFANIRETTPLKIDITNIKDSLQNIKVLLEKIPENNNITQEVIKELPKDIEKLLISLKDIQGSNTKDIQAPKLEQFTKDIKTLETKITVNNILQQIKPIDINNNSNLTKDVKAVLLQINEQLAFSSNSENIKETKASVEKLLTQIEFFQLYSYTSVTNTTYLPFMWENIEEGDIKFDSSKDEKFSCQINLTLKNYGELKVLLQLENKNNLLINIAVEELSLKEKIQENLQRLRSSISSLGLQIQALNIFDSLKDKNKSYEQNAYENNNHIDFGLDIKI